MNENDCDRILDSFFGGAQRVFDYRICSGGAALRAYPWAPNRFVHLEVTTEKLESSPAWQFGYLGTGYSVHLNCRHSDVGLQLLLARGLESHLRTIKKHLGQDIYVPGRYRQSRDVIFLVEDMCRIPHSDDGPTLVGCRLAQYALALRRPVDELLQEAGYPASSASNSSRLNIFDLHTGFPSTQTFSHGSRPSGASRSVDRQAIRSRQPRTGTASRSE